MLPVPYINVDEAEINFNAKIIDIKRRASYMLLMQVEMYLQLISRAKLT